MKMVGLHLCWAKLPIHVGDKETNKQNCTKSSCPSILDTSSGGKGEAALEACSACRHFQWWVHQTDASGFAGVSSGGGGVGK
jgi:hypothetical protein